MARLKDKKGRRISQPPPEETAQPEYAAGKRSRNNKPRIGLRIRKGTGEHLKEFWFKANDPRFKEIKYTPHEGALPNVLRGVLRGDLDYALPQLRLMAQGYIRRMARNPTTDELEEVFLPIEPKEQAYAIEIFARYGLPVSVVTTKPDGSDAPLAQSSSTFNFNLALLSVQELEHLRSLVQRVTKPLPQQGAIDVSSR